MMRGRTLSSICAAAIAALSLAGCGDDDGGDLPKDGPVDAALDAALDAAPTDAASGQIWIRANGIVGLQGKVLLAFVRAGDGGQIVGGICVGITSSPMSFVEAAKVQAGQDPCTLGAAGMYANGTYSITAGIYTPGSQTPERCASTTVTVNGSGDVTLPAFGACP